MEFIGIADVQRRKMLAAEKRLLAAQWTLWVLMAAAAVYIFTVAIIGWPKVERRAQEYKNGNMTMTVKGGN